MGHTKERCSRRSVGLDSGRAPELHSKIDDGISTDKSLALVQHAKPCSKLIATSTSRYWSKDECERFEQAVSSYGTEDFASIATVVETRSPAQVRNTRIRYTVGCAESTNGRKIIKIQRLIRLRLHSGHDLHSLLSISAACVQGVLE